MVNSNVEDNLQLCVRAAHTHSSVARGLSDFEIFTEISGAGPAFAVYQGHMRENKE